MKVLSPQVNLSWTNPKKFLPLAQIAERSFVLGTESASLVKCIVSV